MDRSSKTTDEKRPSLFGCMKGLFALSDGFDPMAPMDLDPDWDQKYKPER